MKNEVNRRLESTKDEVNQEIGGSSFFFLPASYV
jgi:hypothetical protein